MQLCAVMLNFLLVIVISGNLLGISSSIPAGYKHIAYKIEPIERDGGSESHPHIPAPGKSMPGMRLSQQMSINWCGYVGIKNIPNINPFSVTAVYGSWIVPSIVASRDNTYSSIWIGIDGYSSSSVEQIGTAHDWVKGKAEHYAWFEMYPGRSYLINGFPVRPGDTISGAVEYAGNNVFILRLINHTKKVATTVPTNYTTSSQAQRSSVEWIVEAPYFHGILPLTQFKPIKIFNCSAIIDGNRQLLNNNNWLNISLRMVDQKNITKAASSSIGVDKASFMVTWQHH